MKSPLLSILFEDEHLIAVAKPPHLATIPGRGESDSLLEELSRQTGLACTGTGDPRLRIVHRLDKDTSGVLLLAKDLPTQRHLSNQFQHQQVKKEYLAIVVGRLPGDDGVIDAALAPHPSSRDRMAVSKHGRTAITEWKVERKMRRFSLLRCFPKTGRTHQIRVHLQSIGLPLAVDSLYNPTPPDARVGIYLSDHKRDYRPTARQEERPLIGRLTLHAEKITFVHPDGREILIECPMPKDFRAAVSQLGKLTRG
ncbi:MAG TPA: RluA family pseudouridine synthase [Tepidisphaeraceae bacterium]|jgi:23S rRNA pseudouridine955/2504/2580 synthase/23S rRNA pseudouridine1911/1915/1917 synthase